jgi:hypothetical protein
MYMALFRLKIAERNFEMEDFEAVFRKNNRVSIVVLLVEHNNAPQVKCADAQDCAVME